MTAQETASLLSGWDNILILTHKRPDGDTTGCAIASLQRFKDSVKEVAQGYECGITFEKWQDIKEGDIIEAFLMEQIQL